MRIVTRPNVGGPMRQAVALWHAHRRAGMPTLLVVGVCADGEAAFDLAATGIPRVEPERAAGDPRRARDARPSNDVAGLCVVPDLGRSVRPLRDLRAARALRGLIERWRPDVVHTHTSKAGWLGRRAAQRAGVPVVAHTYHGHVFADYYARPVGRALAWIERRLARRTGLAFAVSESCRAELLALDVADEVHVHRPAVDVSAFVAADRAAARRCLSIADRRRVLGFVGRLVPIKRPDLFVEVVGHLPDAVGVVFGDGPLRGALERHAERAAPGRVRFRGAVPDLAAELAAVDVLVMPSRREGFPLAGVEAAACGIPTVGFDVPGVRDLLDASGSPYAARGDDAEALSAAVGRALLDGGLGPAAAATARTLVASCAPDAVAAELSAAYRDALSRSAAGRAAGPNGRSGDRVQ